MYGIELISPWWRISESANWVSTGSDNGLMPVQRQAIIWTNADLLSIGPLGTKFSDILIKIQNFSLMKMCLKNGVCEMVAILSRSECVKLGQYCACRCPTHLNRSKSSAYTAILTELTHLRLNKLAAISQTTFSSAFYSIKFVPKDPIENK